MIIPKQFDGLGDLQAMLLTSILGTLVALKEDLISIKQANSYWFSEVSVEIFTQIEAEEEFLNFLKECNKLEELQPFETIYQNKITELIETAKNLLKVQYTEYDNLETGVSVS